jgi:hypothetical protein
MPARKPIEHGTYRGYQQHRRRGEETCPPCRAANTAYHQEWRTGQPEEAKRNAAVRKAARLRALESLARKYPDEYVELLARELSVA